MLETHRQQSANELQVLDLKLKQKVYGIILYTSVDFSVQYFVSTYRLFFLLFLHFVYCEKITVDDLIQGYVYEMK